MPRTSKRGLLDQIAQAAQNDQVIINVTLAKGKALLPLEGKINAKGDYAYISLPAVQGLYTKDSGGNLIRAGYPGAEVEALFFPERKAELEAKAAELAQLKELARKHGFTLAAVDGVPKATRAPRGSGKPKAPSKPMPSKGDKFTSTQNGILYTVDSVDGKTLNMTGEDGSKKSFNYVPIFWRWYKPV